MLLFVTLANAQDPQVVVQVQPPVQCVDVTTPEPIPAMCVYFTMDDLKFSTSYRIDDSEQISIVYYPEGGDPVIVTKDQVKEIISEKQLGKSI